MTVQWTTVDLWSDGSRICVGKLRPRAPFDSTFSVGGGTISVDASDPTAVPLACIDDLDVAGDWLADLYGDEVAAAAAGLDGSEQRINVESKPGYLAEPLARFGLGLWFLRRWPSCDGVPALRRDAVNQLRVELGILAWHCQDAMGELGTAEVHLIDQLDTIDSDAENGTSAIFSMSAIEAFIDSVDTDPATYERLRGLQRAGRQATSAASQLDDETIARQLGALAGSVTAGDVVARDASSPFAARQATRSASAPVSSGTASIDWAQVPARCTRGVEGNVSWTVRPDGENLAITLSVPRGDSNVPVELRAAVYRNGFALPVADLALQARTDAATGRRWVASGTLTSADLTDDFDVNVYAPSLRRPPALSEDERNQRLAERRAVVDRVQGFCGDWSDQLVDPTTAELFERTPPEQLQITAPWRFGLRAAADA